jgi:hypothetical protein
METEEGQVVEEKTDGALHEELENLRELMRTAGWATLVELLNETVFERKTAILFESVVDTEGDYMQNLLRNEFNKGFLKGVLHAVGFPRTHVGVLLNQLGLDRPEPEDD